MDFITLTKDNVRMYAIKHYFNPSCASYLEFEEDFERLKYIKILLNKVINNKEMNIRILINHIISFTNVFERPAAIKILFFNNDEEAWTVLATILYWLKMMPKRIRLNDVEIDAQRLIVWDLLERLQQI